MLRKARKLLKLLRVASYRSALRHGVAASIEHSEILARESFATLIDVGANRGQFSLAARHQRPEAMIYAFEPLSGPADLYDAVFAGDARVRLFRMAIGAEAGEGEVRVAEKSDSSSLLDFDRVSEVFGQADQIGVERTRIAPLSEAIGAAELAHPVLCKIDVQGFELEVLRGCGTLLDVIDMFYIECSTISLYAGQALFDDIHGFLREHGFALARVGHVSGVPREPGIQGDFLFKRKTA